MSRPSGGRHRESARLRKISGRLDRAGGGVMTTRGGKSSIRILEIYAANFLGRRNE
jgi:hypothetical protein